MRWATSCLPFLAVCFAGGCTTPPPLDPLNRISVQTVIRHINCEIQNAVQGNSVLATWYVKYDLSLQVDQNGSVSPSITVIRPYHSTVGTLNLGAGFNLSGTATRIETITVKAKLSEMNDRTCLDNSTSKVDIAGDLGIKDWINSATMSPIRFPEAPKDGKLGAVNKPEADAIGHTAQFVFIAGANATPTLLLEKFKGPSGSGTFASVSRTDTNKIVIAISNQDPNTTKATTAFDRLLTIQHLQLIPQLNNENQ